MAIPLTEGEIPMNKGGVKEVSLYSSLEAVVKCKDCIWHKPDGNCDYGNKPDDWFCADGVRKDDG